MEYDSLLNAVQQAPSLARKLILEAGDDRIVDALAEVRESEKGLATERKLGASEVEAGQTGKDWVLKQGKTCERSYNFPSIITKVADALGVSLLAALRYLIDNGAVELTWKISKLRPIIREQHLDITTVQHEIQEGEDADIGENWVNGYPSYERKE